MIKDGIKKCSKCGEWKELSEFGKSKSTKNGLNYYCRSCVNTINAKKRDKINPNRKKRPKIENLIKDGKKMCLRCKEYKSFSEFYKNKLAKTGLDIYCVYCSKQRNKKQRDKKTPNRKIHNKRCKLDTFGNGKNIIYGLNKEEILVDEYNYNKLIKLRWVVNSSGYARSNRTSMHRLIMKAKNGDVVDHVNGNKLDNRMCNLRFCTKKENCRHKTKLNKKNKSGKTGVGYYKNTCKWIARITTDKKRINLGYFDDLEDAIEARKVAEEKYFGEFKPII